MSFNGNDKDAMSLPDVLEVLRRLRNQPQPADPISQLQAELARDARLPKSGGLFGAGYARYMADNAPLTSSAAIDGAPVAPGSGQAGFTAAGNVPTAGASPVPAVKDANFATPPVEPRSPDFAASPQIRTYIQQQELNELTHQPYFKITPDSKQNPTFGYGHKVEPNERAALEAQLHGLNRNGRQALMNKLFEQDLAAAEQRVRDRLGPEALQTLTRAQYDALVADSFNAGSGGALGPKMLQNIWDGDMAAAGNRFDAIQSKDAKTGKRDVMAGLAKRNLQEAAIFNRGDYGYQPTQQEIQELEDKVRRASTVPSPKRP